MISHIKKLAYLFVLLTLIQSTFQQPEQPNPPSQNLANTQQTIQFKDNTLESHLISFTQPHYIYDPEIPQDYSIVHTVLEPSSKFVSTLPKDSFVQKLNPKISLPTQQIQQKAQDILKKQTIEQQAKLKEQKQTTQQQTSQTTNSPKTDSIPKPQQKSEPQTPQKTSQNPKQLPTKQQLPPKQQQKPQAPEVDLLASIGQKKLPQLPKDKNQISFKQHQVAKPLTITTYPFEAKKQPQNSKQMNQQPKATEIQKQHKQEVKKVENLQKQAKAQTKKQPQTKIEQQAKQVKPAVNKPIVVQEKGKQIGVPGKVQGQKRQNSQSLDASSVQQFKQLTKELSTAPQKIKHSLEFESLVKQQIKQSDWKLLIIKLAICLTIVISIYQAGCSSESQQKKIQKGKYSPLGVSEVDTENSLDMTDRAEQR